MNLIQIDTEKCQKDRLCIIECPFNVLRENSKKFPEVNPDTEYMCMKCGHCLAVCPTGALTLENLTPESCAPSSKHIAVGVAEMETLLTNRRSVRVYKNKPVAREQIAHLMEMVRWAPTAKNLQPVHWLLVDDKEKIHELARMTIEYLKAGEVFPEMITAWESGEDMILRSAPLLAIAYAAKDALNPSVDCAIAITSLELAATSYGIGSFWAGYFMRAATQYEPIAEYLNLPENNLVFGALGLGYPKFTYHRIPQRQPSKVSWF